MKLIGISGKAGTGKDFITRQLLVPMLTGGNPYIIASFADHFKLESIVKENLDRSKVYGRKDKETRTHLQRKGTEEGRNVYGDNLWVDILNERLLQYQERGIEYVFITDCRFLNEIQYIHSKGGEIIRIEANDRHQKAMTLESNNDTTILNHISETAVSEYTEWDYILDNTEENKNLVQDVTDICTSILEVWKEDTPLTVFFDVDYVLKTLPPSLNSSYSSSPAVTAITDIQNTLRGSRVVLVTLGNPITQAGKLFGVNAPYIEYVVAKDVTTYLMLKQKYPSKYYHMIGGSVLEASKAGITVGYSEV